MDKLYKKSDHYGVILNIFEFLNPIYVCKLQKRNNDSAANFACTSKYFNNLSQKYILPKYGICSIQRIYKPICKTHCRAFPILSLVYKEFKYFCVQSRETFIHFQTKIIADFAPHLVPDNIILKRRCCGGIGWGFTNTSEILNPNIYSEIYETL